MPSTIERVREGFLLPDIGEGLTEAEVITWLVQPGDAVAADQPVIEVLTDKSTVELPSPHAGVLGEHTHAPGDIVAVGTELFSVETSAIAAAPVAASTESAPPVGEATPIHVRPKAAPATRRAARELGIDLHTVVGSGPGGRILPSDLEEPLDPRPTDTPPAPAREAASSAATTSKPLRGIRRTVAQTMTQAWAEIPHIHLFDDVDATELLALRRNLREQYPERAANLTLTAFFVAAAAQALRHHRVFNSSIDLAADTITEHAAINIGFATATSNGVVVPVIAAADRLSLIDIAEAITELSTAARAGTVSHGDLQGGTFTITNYGTFGGHRATPIIRPPESGILGLGRIGDHAVVKDDTIEVRPVLPVVIGADHRLIDGDVGVAFLQRIIDGLQNPLGLIAGV